MAYTNDQLAALLGASSMAELAGRGGSNVGRYGDWTANLTAQQYNDLLNQFGAISFPSLGISYNLPYSSKTYPVGDGGFNLSYNAPLMEGGWLPESERDPSASYNWTPASYNLIWHPSLAGEAAVDAEDAASSDKEGALALGAVLALAGGAAGLFGGAAGGASATGAGATGAAAGTTASGMLAAQNAELLAMGFSPADIAAGMEGLGTAAGAGATGAGLAEASGTAATNGGGGMWDWLTNLVSSGDTSPAWLNADGSVNYNALAAQDYADFGTTGVNALGGSLGGGDALGLGASVDWTSPYLTSAQEAAMLNGSGSSLLSSLGSNATSLGKSALNSLLTKQGMGGLLGAALGGMSGQKQAGTTTTTTAPWSGQQPYLLDAFQKASEAANGNALTQQANTNYSSVLNGPTSNPMLGLNNPYLQTAIDNANNDVTRAYMPAMNAANRASGSYGNSGVADVYSKALTDAYGRNATNMRMTDYTNQQNLQQQAVNNTLSFTGNANTYNAQPAQQYAQTIQGNYGSSTSQPYYNNPYANIMGGAVAGYNLFK